MTIGRRRCLFGGHHTQPSLADREAAEVTFASCGIVARIF
jgi:hypothetical protein